MYALNLCFYFQMTTNSRGENALRFRFAHKHRLRITNAHFLEEMIRPVDRVQ
jgi:hypothetical protein